eukprot:1833298-Prymnesium_polylepis.1
MSLETAPESQAWLPSETDGVWVKARVLSQGDDGTALLEELETKKQHTEAADVRGRTAHAVRGRSRNALTAHSDRTLAEAAACERAAGGWCGGHDSTQLPPRASAPQQHPPSL